MSHISIVTPVYKAEDCLYELYRRIKSSLETLTLDFEIIMVEDCGGDNSWEIIQELSQQDFRVKGIQFSRNFGQHYGITAGLDHCNGDWIVVMDCDLQDQPEEIIPLYKKAMEGYDLVLAKRANRQDNVWKKLASYLYYRVLAHFTEGRHDHTIANFGIYSCKVIEKFCQFKERDRLFPLIIKMLGFHTATLEVQHAERFAGKTSYSLYKQIKLAVDGIISQSNKLLTYSIRIGFVLAVSAISYALYLAIKYLIWGVPVEGWTSIMIRRHTIVGACSVVMLGVELKEGTSIGAMSLVRKSTEEWSIYVGNPAKKIKARSRELLVLEQEFLKEYANIVNLYDHQPTLFSTSLDNALTHT